VPTLNAASQPTWFALERCAGADSSNSIGSTTIGITTTTTESARSAPNIFNYKTLGNTVATTTANTTGDGDNGVRTPDTKCRGHVDAAERRQIDRKMWLSHDAPVDPLASVPFFHQVLVWVGVCVCARTHKNPQRRKCTHTHTHIQPFTHTHTHTHTHTDTHTNTHKHTCRPNLLGVRWRMTNSRSRRGRASPCSLQRPTMRGGGTPAMRRGGEGSCLRTSFS
jgi:hypothetical protein